MPVRRCIAPIRSTRLKKLGPVLVQYFGMGEVTGNITVLPPSCHSLNDDEMPVGSCGFPRTGMEITIMDDNGGHLPSGTTGEICVRGPGVFAGYHDNPDATEKATLHGWFHTGDLGHMDERGFVYITGRASDMYISGGSNVYPREIEEVLLTHPAIAEACVVGMPHEKWGETGVAVLVLNRGYDGDRRSDRERISRVSSLATNTRPRSLSGRNCPNPAMAKWSSAT